MKKTYPRRMLGALLSLLLGACGTDDINHDGTGGGGTGGGGGSQHGLKVRFAHLSPDTPSFDVCLSDRNANANQFVGPLLRGLGRTAGLAYRQVSEYLNMPLAQGVDYVEYNVRIVAPAQADCARSLVPDLHVGESLYLGDVATLALVGEQRPDLFSCTGYCSFAVWVYRDQPRKDSAIALRFINASPGAPALDLVGFGLSHEADYPKPWDGTGIDANGYQAGATAGQMTLSIRLHNGATDLKTLDINAGTGSVITVFAVGSMSSTTTPLETIWCGDNSMPMGHLSSCTR